MRRDGRVGYGARLRLTLTLIPGGEIRVGSSPTLVWIYLRSLSVITLTDFTRSSYTTSEVFGIFGGFMRTATKAPFYRKCQIYILYIIAHALVRTPIL